LWSYYVMELSLSSILVDGSFWILNTMIIGFEMYWGCINCLFFNQFWCSFFLWLDCACQPKSFQKYDEGIPLPLTVSQIKLSEKGIPKFELSYFSCKFNALFYKMIIFMGYWWTIRQMSKIHWVHNIAGSNTLLYPTLFCVKQNTVSTLAFNIHL
jgi:hypothetical protein